MNINNLKIKKKLMKTEINCVPAKIRHCNGFIIEALTSNPERKLNFELIGELVKNHGYNMYSLRHKDNDWSEPHYITSEGILVNRFGWFLTKDKMKFKNIQDEIRLTVSNTIFINVNNIDYRKIYEVPYYGNCTLINVLDYFLNEDKIFN